MLVSEAFPKRTENKTHKTVLSVVANLRLFSTFNFLIGRAALGSGALCHSIPYDSCICRGPRVRCSKRPCRWMHMCADACTCMHAHACICMHMHAYACRCMHMHAYVCIHMHAYACTYMHMHAYARICMHMYVYACICMHMHAYA